jgi:hypothetical protein
MTEGETLGELREDITDACCLMALEGASASSSLEYGDIE